MSTIYIIGSLRNPDLPYVGRELRSFGWDVFDSWFSAGERADDAWQEHETLKGNDYPTALKGYAAQNVFNFDKRHLERADIGVLVMPAGKSGHLELGWMLGKGKPGFILHPAGTWPERWDVMAAFADGVFNHVHQLTNALEAYRHPIKNCGAGRHSWDVDGFGVVCEFCQMPKIRKATYLG